jgi:hypothetical protein
MMGGKNGRPVALSRSLDITNFVRYTLYVGLVDLDYVDLDLDPYSGFLVNLDPNLDPGFKDAKYPVERLCDYKQCYGSCAWIRIDFGRLDPDPAQAGQNHKIKRKKMFSFNGWIFLL